MAEILKKNPAALFSRGFFYPFRALSFFNNHPGLLRYVLIPLLINVIVFSGTLYFGLGFFNETVVQHLPVGDAWYWSLLYYGAWLLAFLLTIVLVFFTFTVIGNLIASPFNDLLSERAEELLTGETRDEPFALREFFKDARRVIGIELKKLFLFVIGMLLLLLLNLIPAAGPFIYSLAAALFTLFFLSVEYLGYVFERKKYRFGDQRRYISERKFLTLGFGTGVFCLLSIPFLQFLCIPMAVLGGTILWVENHPESNGGTSQ